MASRCSECGALNWSTQSGTPITIDSNFTSARRLELLRTNEPLEAAELSYIQAVRSASSARLASLEEDIAQLRLRLEQLEDERAVLAESCPQLTTVLSPLRRVPPEILAEIFSWTLPGPDDGFSLAGSKVRHSPWILGHVSRRWRAVALSIPSLWSLVHVVGKMTMDSLPMLRTQVGRARTLKIHFVGYEHRDPEDTDSEDSDSDSESGDEDPTTQLELFDFLSEHSARWIELNIVITADLAPRLAALRGRLPLLERVWIQWARKDTEDAVHSIQCFDAATSLVDVGVFNEKPYTMLPLFCARQLTSYRAHASWGTHCHVLDSAPNIVEARISVIYDEEDWPEPSDYCIDMPHLRRLFVSDVEILEYLRAPALIGLAFCLEREFEETPLDSLHQFFARSSCTPHQLCIEGTPDAHTTAEILNKYPFMTSFFLTTAHEDPGVSMGVLNEHLTMLTVGDAPAVSPHLREICLGSMRATPIDYPLFLNMLQSRRRSPRCALTAASFLTYRSLEPDSATLSGLKALREHGMSVSVMCGQHSEVRWRMKRLTYRVPWIY